eukprot:TRINITY_DN1125_c0_g1_i7.p1 TRINITY_DN1125_c0_g1~~TRINITY_DN1125_c0_g1_i7.p1  ORF type:complete len:108 (+),score=5.67 TRINITY_DN1125_c0_g1_i7:187-510(+)
MIIKFLLSTFARWLYVQASMLKQNRKDVHQSHSNPRNRSSDNLQNPPVCSMATSIKSSSSSPSFSAESSGAIRSPSTMKRTCEACNPRRLQYASISFRKGVVFLILN